MFMSVNEVGRLTGKVRNSAQIRWLKLRGYRHEVNGIGQPVVAIAEFLRRNVGGRATKESQEPNWER
jgi:hypothetical protein